MKESKFPEWLLPLGVYKKKRMNSACYSVTNGKRTRVKETKWSWNSVGESNKGEADSGMRLKGVRV